MPRPFVWETQDGYKTRVSHMSDEHVLNAIQWLTGHNMNQEMDEFTVGEWIAEFSRELYRRLHPELING